MPQMRPRSNPHVRATAWTGSGAHGFWNSSHKAQGFWHCAYCSPRKLGLTPHGSVPRVPAEETTCRHVTGQRLQGQRGVLAADQKACQGTKEKVSATRQKHIKPLLQSTVAQLLSPVLVCDFSWLLV